MMRFQQRSFALALLLVAASGSSIAETMKAPQSKSDAGYVLEVEGKWYLEKKPREYLAVGQRLAAGEVIRIMSPATSDHIVIAGPSGEIVIKRYCDKRGDCARRLIVPSPAETEPSVFDVIFQTAMRLIRGKPDRYSVHGVRGGNNDLEEAVCQFDKGTLSLSPVFRNMPRGLYYLKLRNLQPGASRTSLGPLRFDWDPQGGSVLPVSGLIPGMYEIRLLLRTSDEYEPTSLTVWTLISIPSEFDRTNNSFRQGVTLTNKWGKRITDETKREVLRAYLDNLATAR
jgi:hypothetical protein